MSFGLHHYRAACHNRKRHYSRPCVLRAEAPAPQHRAAVNVICRRGYARHEPKEEREIVHSEKIPLLHHYHLHPVKRKEHIRKVYIVERHRYCKLGQRGKRSRTYRAYKAGAFGEPHSAKLIRNCKQRHHRPKSTQQVMQRQPAHIPQRIAREWRKPVNRVALIGYQERREHRCREHGQYEQRST